MQMIRVDIDCFRCFVACPCRPLWTKIVSARRTFHYRRCVDLVERSELSKCKVKLCFSNGASVSLIVLCANPSNAKFPNFSRTLLPIHSAPPHSPTLSIRATIQSHRAYPSIRATSSAVIADNMLRTLATRTFSAVSRRGLSTIREPGVVGLQQGDNPREVCETTRSLSICTTRSSLLTSRSTFCVRVRR